MPSGIPALPIRPGPRFTLLGVGAMNSPRYAPVGLLTEYATARVVIDGGPGATPAGPVAAWLVTDERARYRLFHVSAFDGFGG